MSQIAYTVICTIQDEARAQQWLAWLTNGHIDEVLAGGASSADIIKLDDEMNSRNGITYEVRYNFNNRRSFEEYIKTSAPRLREDGLKRFPPADGFDYSRTIGEVISQ